MPAFRMSSDLRASGRDRRWLRHAKFLAHRREKWRGPQTCRRQFWATRRGKSKKKMKKGSEFRVLLFSPTCGNYNTATGAGALYSSAHGAPETRLAVMRRSSRTI